MQHGETVRCRLFFLEGFLEGNITNIKKPASHIKIHGKCVKKKDLREFTDNSKSERNAVN